MNHVGITSSGEVRDALEEEGELGKKRKLCTYSPTVGAQADSQAHVAVRKAHEAAAVAIDTTYYPQDGANGIDHPRQINVMLTCNQLNPYNTNGGPQRATPASRGVVTITSCRSTDLALIHDAVESAIFARVNPQDPRAANAPTLQVLSRQPDTTWFKRSGLIFLVLGRTMRGLQEVFALQIRCNKALHRRGLMKHLIQSN